MLGEGERAESGDRRGQAVGYTADVGDEFVKPTIVSDQDQGRIRSGDEPVIFFNFRADRARQLTRAFVLPDFDGFERKRVAPIRSTSSPSGRYGVPLRGENGGRVPANAGSETPLAKVVADARPTSASRRRDREVRSRDLLPERRTREGVPSRRAWARGVPSPKVATYDLQPEMSAEGVADETIKPASSGRLPNSWCSTLPTRTWSDAPASSTPRSPPSVRWIRRVWTGSPRRPRIAGGVLVVTADHGNAEEMIETNRADRRRPTRPTRSR